MSWRIEGQTLSLILDQDEHGRVHLIWFGPKTGEDMAREPQFRRLASSPDIPVGPSLAATGIDGFEGVSALDAFERETLRQIHLIGWTLSQDETGLTVSAESSDGVRLNQTYRFSGDVLTVHARLENTGKVGLIINRLAAGLIPAPDWASQVLTHSGDWGREGHAQRRDWLTGRVEQSSTAGRPGFDGGPTLTLLNAGTDFMAGRALSAHLAWSGPFCLAAIKTRDGQGQILAEQVYGPGEQVLEPGQTLHAPPVWFCVSDKGLNGVSHALHDQVRQTSRPVSRKIHFNTWEARYFAVDEASTIDLAKKAATLGVDRFILDDGWFKNRRDDTTSLGDWTVDPTLYPAGLGPLIKAVQDTGMGFGLWFEPEMVSPDSELYRAHPDWVMGYPNPNLPTGRHQLVLNLGRVEVRDYLFEAISALVRAHPIDYIKWDCNRDIYPATYKGRAATTGHIEGLYALLARLNQTFPDLEIESCASGGGRIEAGIAPFVTRFWTSDATDAIDRVRIQRAASLIMPPEILGAHIGPSPNPMTGREIPLNFRILTAFFGHLGLEADPDQISDGDQTTLRFAFDLYKDHRDWIGTARHWQIQNAPDVTSLISADQSCGFIRILRVDTPSRPTQPRIRFAGLDPKARYSLSERVFDGEFPVWPLGEYPGASLMGEGLDLDPGRALTGRLIYLERVG